MDQPITTSAACSHAGDCQSENVDLDRMTSAVLRHEWQPGHNFSPTTAHLNHQYDASCAVCRGDVRAILTVALGAS